MSIPPQYSQIVQTGQKLREMQSIEQSTTVAQPQQSHSSTTEATREKEKEDAERLTTFRDTAEDAEGDLLKEFQKGQEAEE